jgi:hypothetical protein
MTNFIVLFSSAADLYSGGVWFESWPANRQSDKFSVTVWVPLGKYLESNSLRYSISLKFVNYWPSYSSTFRDTERFVKNRKKKKLQLCRPERHYWVESSCGASYARCARRSGISVWLSVWEWWNGAYEIDMEIISQVHGEQKSLKYRIRN